MSSKKQNASKLLMENEVQSPSHNKNKVAAKKTKDFIAAEKNAENDSLIKSNFAQSSIDSNSSFTEFVIPNVSSLDSSIIDLGPSDSISIDSNTSGQFVTLSSLSDTKLANNDSLEEVIVSNDDQDEDTNTSVYHSLDSRTTSKTPNLDQSSVSEASTLTGDSDPNIKIYNSIEEFEKNLPPTVTLLKTPNGSKVYIVGTAHFSKESQDDVSLVIRNARPDVVMVELCAARVHMLNHDEKTLLEEARDINFAKIRSITKSNGLVNGLFYILMLNMSAKITQDLGMAPGGEFRRAVEEMHHLPNPVLHLGDRSINITLQRALNGLSLWQTIKIVFKLLFSNKTITKEEVEQCKQKDLLEELMEQMAGEYPVFRDVFVSERDLYLCHSLTIAAKTPALDTSGRPKATIVVGVVGIGHTAGICKNWGKIDESKLPEIMVVPPAKLSIRLFKFTVKYGMLGLIGFGIYKIVRPRIPAITF